MRQKVLELAAANPRYGFRRVHALLHWVNLKAVHRIWSQEGLRLRRKPRRRLKVEREACCTLTGVNQADDNLVQLAIDRYLELAPPLAEVLSLQRLGIVLPEEERFRGVEWPEEPSLEERAAAPHQALRWIKGEDYPHELLQRHERSPLKAWLDDVESAAPARFL